MIKLRAMQTIPLSWLHAKSPWLYLAVAFHIACAAVLVPVASHPYDLAVLSGNAQAWLNWGFSPFYNWKFGLDYSALTVLAQALRAFLAGLGVPGTVAIHVAWKLPLVAANLLTAGVMYRLALRLAPGRAVLLASLWLVNPVVLWVSAGHGQIESVAILCVFAALALALEGRLFASGLVTGMGVGFEYFPIAVVGLIIVWWRAGQLPGRRPLVLFGAGLLLSLAVWFLPVILDPVGRPSLFGGLAFSGGFSSTPNQSLLTIWAWLGYRWAFLWPLLLAISGIACLALAWRFAKPGPAAGLVFLSMVLILAVLLDVNALPQFSMIAAAALWLLALVVPVQPFGMIAVPVAGETTAFLWLDRGASTANAYFFDAWAATGAQLWPVPQSEQATVLLGHVFSLGLVALIIYVVAMYRAPRWLEWPTAAVGGAGLCLLLVVWASQPAIWRAALSAAPSANLPDFDQFVATRDGHVVVRSQDTLEVSYSESLIAASRQGSVRPLIGLDLSVEDLYSHESATKALPAQSWPNRLATIPRWERFSSTIQSLWVEVLVGSPSWSETSPPKTSDIALRIGQASIPPERLRLVSSSPGLTGWALVDFRVPSTAVDAKGRLDLLPSAPSLMWNGSDEGPWVRILPASGALNALIDGAATQVTFQLDPAGQGYAVGFPLRTSYLVSLNGAELPTYQVNAAVLRWPTTPERWRHNPWFQFLGAGYGLLLVIGTAWLLLRSLTSRTPATEVSPEPSHAWADHKDEGLSPSPEALTPRAP